MPEIIDPVFVKIRPKRSFSMTAYERFGLVFTKTGVYKFGHSKVVELVSKGTQNATIEIGFSTTVLELKLG